MLLDRRVGNRVIVLDGDDTLWMTQELYDDAKAQFFALLSELGHDRDAAAVKFSEIDVANVAQLGLSRRRFPGSMQETYEVICREAGTVPDEAIVARVVALGNAVFDTVPSVRPDAAAMLNRLRQSYGLVLFTAGDRDVQRSRIEQSGLGVYFDAVHIPPEKTLDAWHGLLRAEGLTAASTWSVGNSVRSDINPALQLGLRCVVVAARTWNYESVALAEPPDGTHVWHATTLAEAAQIILRADGITTDVAPSREMLMHQLRELRTRLEPAFAPDTALLGARGATPSAGHCAVVAAVVQQCLGGDMISSRVEGESHWFNRLPSSDGPLDVDLSGDQFGFSPIQVAPAGELHSPAVVRPFAHLLPETLERAARFATRAALPDVARTFRNANGKVRSQAGEDGEGSH